MSPRIRDPESALVRPRLVWLGMGLAILSLVVTSLGLMGAIAWLAWTGAGTTVVGLLLAWRGGVHFDVQLKGQAPHRVRDDVLTGAVRSGVSPAARIEGPEVRRRAVRASRRRRALLADAEATRTAHPRSLAAIGLLAVGAWLFSDQWLLDYRFTPAGQDQQLRDAAFFVLVTAAGLRLRLRPRSRTASAACLIGGLGLTVSGALTLGGTSLVGISDLCAGIVVLLLTPLTLR